MANMCVSEKGYKRAEEIRFEALSKAAALKSLLAGLQIAANASSAISNYNKMRQVADESLRVEEELHAHLKNTYWPAEEQMLNEFTVPEAQESQAVLAKRYAGRMWAPYAAQSAKALRKLECEKPRYCGNAHIKLVQELMVQRAATRANVTLWADRIAYYELEAFKERDIERRKQVIAMRQGLLGQATALLQQAAGGFAASQQNAMGAINSAIRAFGIATEERGLADAGIGRDPAFHSRTGVGAQLQEGMMEPMYGYAPVGSDNIFGTTMTDSVAAPQTSGVAVTAPGAEPVNSAEYSSDGQFFFSGTAPE